MADGVVTKFTYIRINFFVFAVTFTDVCPYGMLEANAVISPVLYLKIIIYDTSDTDFSVKKMAIYGFYILIRVFCLGSRPSVLGELS